jgi:sugar phosphate isomerase/epimerase
VFTAPLADTAPLIARCAAILAEGGAKMAVEFSPLGPVASLPDAVAVAEAARIERAGVLVDTWHFMRGPSTWEDLAAVPVERIAYVQFDDALPMASDDLMDETMNRRVMPGGGEFDLARFAETLLGRGWEGTVSVEVLSSELAALPLEDFATQARLSTIRYWR